MVREPGRPGKEDDGDQLHPRRQEITKCRFSVHARVTTANVVTLCILNVSSARCSGGCVSRNLIGFELFDHGSRRFHSDPRTNRLPSLSLNIAYLPQGCFCGGPSNSTPRFFSCSYVLSMSSHTYDMFMNEPMRFSSPSGGNNTTRVSAFGIRNSIQRCFSSNG